MTSFNSDIPTSRLERLTSSLLVTRSTTELSGIYLSYLSTKYKVFFEGFIIINVHLLVCWVKLRLSTRVGTTALKTTIYLRRKIVRVKKGNGMSAKVVGGWVNYLLK